MDVARSFFPTAVPLRRLPVSALQRVHIIQIGISPRGDMACVSTQCHVPCIIPRQYHNYHHGDSTEARQGTRQRSSVRVQVFASRS